MSTERIRAAFAYKVQATSHGSRKQREFIIRDEAVIEFPNAATCDVQPAVVVGSGFGRQTWLGHGCDLWLPVKTDSGKPMRSGQFLKEIAAGRGQIGVFENPFLMAGYDPIRNEQIFQSPTIEKVALRSVVSNDRTERLSCISRVAQNFMLLDDGRVLRRSLGPLWRCTPLGEPHLVASSYEIPHRFAAWFNVLRREEAKEFSKIEWPSIAATDLKGPALSILQAECIPDVDALLTAREIVTPNAMLSMLCACERRPALKGELLPILEAAGRLYGRDYRLLATGKVSSYCSGMPPVTTQDIVTAVHGTQRYFIEADRIGGGKAREIYEIEQGLWETDSGSQSRRFNVYEYDRLGVAVEAPDLATLSIGTRP